MYNFNMFTGYFTLRENVHRTLLIFLPVTVFYLTFVKFSQKIQNKKGKIFISIQLPMWRIQICFQNFYHINRPIDKFEVKYQTIFLNGYFPVFMLS